MSTETAYRFRQEVQVVVGFYQGLTGILTSFKPSRGAEGNMYLVLLETGGTAVHLERDNCWEVPNTKKVWIPGRHLAAAPAGGE